MEAPYRNVIDHPVDLDDGRTVGPGEQCSVNPVKSPVAQHLVKSGQLVRVVEVKPAEKESA